ncbi:hypothetical protein PMAYCL1PPCAC_09100, partial [Pristionchus mayeri]
SDSSSFVYIAFDDMIYVLDTDRMELLGPLKIETVGSVHSVAGVFNGVITANCSLHNTWYLVTAQLPPGYYDDKKTVGESADVHTLEER